VNFYQPVDIYQATERSVKYAILFIALTFLTLVLFETISSAEIHPMQYLMAGSALVIFYLLLLALAEYTGFTIAYIAAAGANVSAAGEIQRQLSVEPPAFYGLCFGHYFALFAVICDSAAGRICADCGGFDAVSGAGGNHVSDAQTRLVRPQVVNRARSARRTCAKFIFWVWRLIAPAAICPL
jgi:hypothetical protein